MRNVVTTLRTRKARALLLAGAAAVAVIAAWGGPSATPAGDPSAASALDYVRSHRLDLGAPGLAVGIVRPDGVTLGAAGDVTADTPFVIGSATKSFTALAVLQLAEAGRVALDTPAVHYVPDFATSNPAVSNRITVRQLLSHTSGLSTAAGTDPLAEPETTLHRQVLALHAVVAATGSTFAYSNANYEVLGDVIEHVTGGSYGQYVQAHVLTPLGMTHTYTDLPTARAHGLREGHRIWFGVGVGDGYWFRPDFLPSGFLVSTVGDLSHYLSAMLDGGRYNGRTVLSAAGVRSLTTQATPAMAEGMQGGYGYGWYQRPTSGEDLVIDPGITRNGHADLVLVPQRHVAVAVLSDAESALYVTTIPKFDVLAMNVAGIASTGVAAAGGLVEGFYLIFDLIAVAVLALYVTILVRVIRSRTSGLAGRPWYRRLVTLWREFVVPVVILTRLPDAFGEPWRTLVRGDIGLAAGLVAVLGLATLAARALFAYRRSAISPELDSATPAAEGESVSVARATL
jgi:CubicO group peptidase (beta-lactamase class C family)